MNAVTSELYQASLLKTIAANRRERDHARNELAIVRAELQALKEQYGLALSAKEVELRAFISGQRGGFD